MPLNNPPLGRLEKVALRDAWADEAGDFTPWLAREDNLKLLGDTIGLELELEAQEKEVGPFRADILAKDSATGHWVLIENQLERTDHGHLGQLLTYAAGLNAVTIIWIAKGFTDEHRAAIDWLNEHTDESISLFGLEIELWRIGDSPIAPKFNVVCEPNEWARRASGPTGGGSQTQQLQRRFWTEFKKHMEERSTIRCGTPLAQNWMVHPLGRVGANLTSVVSTWNADGKPELRAELCLTNENSKYWFAELEKQRARIDHELGFAPVWYNPSHVRQSKVYAQVAEDFQDESRWPAQFEWLRARIEALDRVFRPLVRNLPTRPTDDGQSAAE